MKINLKNKKIIIPTIIIITILIIVSILGYQSYKQKQLQKKIDTAIAQIEKTNSTFNTKDVRVDKIVILKSILKEHDKYEKSEDLIEQIDEKYHLVIADMKKVFIEEYDKNLIDYTLKDVDKINDKEKLNDAKTKLSELLKTIVDEQNIVCLENKVKEYQTKINNLIKTYEDKIAKIEKEEKAKKEAEEKRAKEEALKQEQHSNSSTSNNANNYSSQPYVIKGKSWTTDKGTTWTYWLSDGSIWYKDYDGNMHDITNNSDIWG